MAQRLTCDRSTVGAPPPPRVQRLVQQRFFDAVPCILATGKGVPDLATRWEARSGCWLLLWLLLLRALPTNTAPMHDRQPAPPLPHFAPQGLPQRPV